MVPAVWVSALKANLRFGALCSILLAVMLIVGDGICLNAKALLRGDTGVARWRISWNDANIPI
jgi:hypothetical protein